MCVLSFVGDHYSDKWRPYVTPPPPPIPNYPWPAPVPGPTKDEFDALRKEVEDVKKLLIKAKQYDIDHGEPDCEMDEKLEILRKVADMVGVDLDEVFG